MRILTLLLICGSYLVKSQDYKKIAEDNMRYLVKSESVYDHFKILDDGIYVYARKGSTRPEFKVTWREVPQVIEYFNKYDYWEFIEFYNSKGTTSLHLEEEQLSREEHKLPVSLTGLKIALDPGHMAGSFKEAVQEKKYIKIEGARIGASEDVLFYESELNYATAYIIKEQLEDLGAEVLITRERGKAAVGKSFDEWYAQDFEIDVRNLQANGDLTSGAANYLLSDKSNKWDAFRYVYQYMDFLGRSRRINNFDPTLTFIIHYNADEYSTRYDERYWDPSEDNYSMAFIPGAFMEGELLKQDARIDFLRLVLTDNIQQSAHLASKIIDVHQKDLGVPALSKDDGSNTIARSSIAVEGAPGVFARNLYLTRSVRSPVVYIESLYQDNIKELKRLATKDYRVDGIKTSSRVKEVADAYIKGLMAWLNENNNVQLTNNKN